MSNKIAILICATKSYAAALRAQASRTAAAVQFMRPETGTIIFANDGSAEVAKGIEAYRALLDGWRIESLVLPVKESGKNLNDGALSVIAQLYTAGFTRARQIAPDYLWTLESDVLPHCDSLATMLWTLQHPTQFYGVACCPYVAQGGGGFMGGYGTASDPIHEDFTPDERQLPAKMEAAYQRAMKRGGLHRKFREHLRRFPLKQNYGPSGNWRRRGWLQFSYMGVGRGCFAVEVDWSGLGCNLFSARALAHLHLDGYQNAGTNDLFLSYHRLAQAGIRIAAIPHVLCDHVTRAGDGYEIMRAFHETAGDYRGHLRVERCKWFDFHVEKPKLCEQTGNP